MKLCQDHWDRLRAAISERGLDNLIAKDGETAFRQAVDGLETDKLSLNNFDPLMYANTAIWSHAIDIGGLAVMALNDDGSERCPICFLSAMHDEHCTKPGCDVPKDGTAFDVWIGKAADDARRTADKLLADA